MSDAPVTVLGIAGSLRAGSYNRALLRAAVELQPPGMSIVIWDRLGEIPLYNGDVEAIGDPERVADLKRALAAADGALIVTPEYNTGIPGGLKNALDWASRPPSGSPLALLPVGVMGASMGRAGTARAQLALRSVFVFTRTLAAPISEVMVARAQTLFDAEGRLTDEMTRKIVAGYLVELEAWVRRMRKSG
jgi:chromate reductase